MTGFGFAKLLGRKQKGSSTVMLEWLASAGEGTPLENLRRFSTWIDPEAGTQATVWEAKTNSIHAFGFTADEVGPGIYEIGMGDDNPSITIGEAVAAANDVWNHASC
jgi:hypothetical protein